MALGSEPITLDPRKATDAHGMRIVELLFQSFIKLDSLLQVKPDAATKWHYKNKTYTFYVPKSLTFSNNRRLKKQDIIFSFKEYRSKKSIFFRPLKIIKSVIVNQNKDFFIVKIKLTHYSAKFLSADLPVLKILPKQEIITSSFIEFQNNPIGTGAFRLKSRTSGKIILEARSHILKAPKIKTVTFKIIRDNFTRFQKTLNKELDIVQGDISLQKVSYFLDRPHDFQVFRSSGLSTTYLLINFKNKCLKQLNMRKVISLSIDRSQIIKYKLYNFAQQASTILNNNNLFFNKKLKLRTYNLKKAKQLFNTLTKACKNKNFLFKTSNNKSSLSIGKLLALQLQKAGFIVKKQSFEWGTFYNDLKTGNFDIALLKWVGVIDPDIYRLAFSSKEHPPNGRNRGFYTNKKLDLLLDQGIRIMNLQKRLKIYNKVQNIIYKDIVIIPLWHEEQISIVQNNILNYSLSKRGDFTYLMNVIKQNKFKK